MPVKRMEHSVDRQGNASRATEIIFYGWWALLWAEIMPDEKKIQGFWLFFLWHDSYWTFIFTRTVAFIIYELGAIELQRVGGKNKIKAKFFSRRAEFNHVGGPHRPNNIVSSGLQAQATGCIFCSIIYKSTYGTSFSFKFQMHSDCANPNTLTTLQFLCYLVLSTEPISSWLLKSSTATRAHLHLCEKGAGK